MKTKEGILSSKIGDDYFLVPAKPEALNLNGIIRLNETGAFIWDRLCEGLDEEQIAGRILEEYSGVDYDSALRTVKNIVTKFRDAKLLE